MTTSDYIRENHGGNLLRSVIFVPIEGETLEIELVDVYPNIYDFTVKFGNKSLPLYNVEMPDLDVEKINIFPSCESNIIKTKIVSALKEYLKETVDEDYSSWDWGNYDLNY